MRALLARRARVTALAMVVGIGSVGTVQPAAAINRPTGLSYVQACTFDPVLNGLTATFSPQLSFIHGTGTCQGLGGTFDTVHVDLAGGSGLTCLGGLESMAGGLWWSTGIPASKTVGVIALGAGTTLLLVLTGPGFTGTATLEWAGVGCPGSFSAPMYGVLAYESS